MPKTNYIEWDIDIAQNLAQAIYYGLTVNDFCHLWGIEHYTFLLNNHQYVKVVAAARQQAKLDLLKKQMEIAKDTKNINSMKAGQYLLGSRFYFAENIREIKSRHKQVREMIEQKERVRKDVNDFKAIALAQEATASQLKEWVDGVEIMGKVGAGTED